MRGSKGERFTAETNSLYSEVLCASAGYIHTNVSKASLVCCTDLPFIETVLPGSALARSVKCLQLHEERALNVREVTQTARLPLNINARISRNGFVGRKLKQKEFNGVLLLICGLF
jgi:hypothetical protein